jgi:hypothetical protein
MPTIAQFFGITIQMYWTDHPPAHLHAFYAGFEAMFAIETGETIGGSLPPKAERMVRDWVLAHRDELLDNWRLGSEKAPFRKVPGADV